jgi:hypothetical protein
MVSDGDVAFESKWETTDIKKVQKSPDTFVFLISQQSLGEQNFFYFQIKKR